MSIYHCVFKDQGDVGAAIPEFMAEWSNTLMLMTIITVGAFIEAKTIGEVHNFLKTTTPLFTLEPYGDNRWCFEGIDVYKRASVIRKTSHTYEQDINAPIYAAFSFKKGDRTINACVYVTSIDSAMIECHAKMLKMSRDLQLTTEEALLVFQRQTIPGRLRLAMNVPVFEANDGKRYLLYNGRMLPTD